MARATVVAVAVVAGLTAGCGYEGRKMAEPADVGGTVTAADGKPVRDVQLVLRPKGEGHPVVCRLGADGRFAGKAVPGDFFFLFEPVEGKKSSLAAVPAKYQDVRPDHVVTLQAGDGNQIKLN